MKSGEVYCEFCNCPYFEIVYCDHTYAVCRYYGDILEYNDGYVRCELCVEEE